MTRYTRRSAVQLDGMRGSPRSVRVVSEVCEDPSSETVLMTATSFNPDQLSVELT